MDGILASVLYFDDLGYSTVAVCCRGPSSDLGTSILGNGTFQFGSSLVVK